MSADELQVDYLWPSAPTQEPVLVRDKRIGPPRSARITDADVYYMSNEALVGAVLTCDNDYSLFGLEPYSRCASIESVGKRAKRLLHRLHPDRNSAPHAATAFKRVRDAQAQLVADLRCVPNE